MIWKSQQTPINLNKIITALLLILITLAGAFLRLRDLSFASLWIDEGFSIIHAKAILTYGYPLLPNGIATWNYFPVHYLMALGLLITSTIEMGGRIFPALAGTLLIPALFMLSKRIFRSTPAAIITALLVASCTYEVAWSRQARSYVCLQLFTTIAIIYFYHFLDARKKTSLIGALAGMFISIATHRAGYLVPAIFGLAIICELKDIKSWWLWICEQRYFVIIILIASISFLFSLGSLTTNSTASTTISQVLTNSNIQYAKQYLWVLWVQLHWILPWTILGGVISLWKHTRRTLPIIFIAGLYFYFISYRSILFHFRYILPILPFILLFVAYGAVCSASIIKKSSGWPKKVIIIISLCLFATSWSNSPFSFIPSKQYELGYTAPQPDWRKAYQWIKHTEEKRLTKITQISTTSTFPMFHDLYLNSTSSNNYFLPYSMSGFPGSFELTPRFSHASVVPDRKTLKSLNTWIILDDFGLRMIKDKEIQDLLMRVRPVKIIRGENSFDIFIWKMGK